METEKQINMAAAYRGMSQAALAKAIGMTPSNFNQKIKKDTFSKSELQRIASALGGTYNTYFEFPGNVKVGIGPDTPEKAASANDTGEEL